MEFIRGLYNLRDRHRGCVMTIGNYDGMHLGHQSVLTELLEQARFYGLPSLAMVFEPTPQEFFAPDKAPARLATLREKIEAFAAFGVDRILCLRFDRRLAQTAPEEFISRILVDGLQPRFLAVGDDFRFGRNREGDFSMLEAAGREQGFRVHAHPAVQRDGRRVSSTRVRDALAAGDTRAAGQLLGQPYCMSGRISAGERLGRTLGFPTANIRVKRLPAPRFGVYAVTVRGVPGVAHSPAVASLGVRPTVGGRECLLESYLLDFEGSLYGQRLSVDFNQFLRPEEHFSSVEAMTGQMQRDLEHTRDYFAGQPVAGSRQ